MPLDQLVVMHIGLADHEDVAGELLVAGAKMTG